MLRLEPNMIAPKDWMSLAGFFAAACAPAETTPPLTAPVDVAADNASPDCDDGFRRPTPTADCKDIDECLEGTHHCGEPPALCVNVPSSHECGCAPGFVRTGDLAGCEPTPPSRLALGLRHSCAIAADATVVCWGLGAKENSPSGEFAQVFATERMTCTLTEDGTPWCAKGLSSVVSSKRFVHLSLSPSDACGVQTDGAVFCWSRHSSAKPPVPDGTFTQVAQGLGNVCGVTTLGEIRCVAEAESNVLAPPEGHYRAIAIAPDASLACGLRVDGTVACWGNSQDSPGILPPRGAFTSISAGTSTFCGTRQDGSIDCWPRERTVPPVPFDEIALGRTHGCGWTKDRRVLCWGSNDCGHSTPPQGPFSQLGAGSRSACGITRTKRLLCWGSEPTGPDPLSSGEYILVDGNASNPGNEHTCAVRSDHSVECWGPDEKLTSPPKLRAQSVGLGSRHACALTTDAEIVCWSSDYNGNYYGQSAPQTGTFTALGVGTWHTCGLRRDGSIACWGLDEEGVSTPPRGRYEQLAVGGEHSCALDAQGRITCWGRNGDGQLENVPAGRYRAISAGYRHTCALDARGHVTCWGALDGVPDPRRAFVALAGGGYFHCGLTSTGEIECWGGDECERAAPNGSLSAPP